MIIRSFENMIIGGVNDSKHVIRKAIRTATFSKGNVAQELRRDSSCATLPFAVLVLRYLLYSNSSWRGKILENVVFEAGRPPKFWK